MHGIIKDLGYGVSRIFDLVQINKFDALLSFLCQNVEFEDVQKWGMIVCNSISKIQNSKEWQNTTLNTKLPTLSKYLN